MTSSSTGLLRSVSCPICYKMLNDPTVLDCGHTFCCSCLEQLQQSSCTVFIFCPVCRKINYDSLFKRKNYCVARIVDVIKSSQHKSYSPPPILKPVTLCSSKINHRYATREDGDVHHTPPTPPRPSMSPPSSTIHIEEQHPRDDSGSELVHDELDVPCQGQVNKIDCDRELSCTGLDSEIFNTGLEGGNDIRYTEADGRSLWWLYPMIALVRDTVMDEVIKLSSPSK